jgi:hypothetical protein
VHERKGAKRARSVGGRRRDFRLRVFDSGCAWSGGSGDVTINAIVEKLARVG